MHPKIFVILSTVQSHQEPSSYKEIKYWLGEMINVSYAQIITPLPVSVLGNAL